ncbi:hypothetical protein DYB25_007477 [Aphanomyces astaci]|uniref:Uncharacterized protein n=1 Tax=Aphanomyces astaci TaxID=112090 RepID=A0A397B262_APHAT|nr:hypothetical protein DYB25_007477 [Aphanomyces astaci]
MSSLSSRVTVRCLASFTKAKHASKVISMVFAALVAWTTWQHLLQVYRGVLLLRKRFPHQSWIKAIRSSWVYATIVLLGDAGNLVFGLASPTLALRTLACTLRLSTKDFSYGPHERNVLDLYGTSSKDEDDLKPVVIFIHGGAWALSSKFHYGAVGETLERHGVVTVVPSYRTFPHGDVEEMLDDLEAIVGTNDSSVGLHVQAFIGLCGPYDITDHYEFERHRAIIPYVRGTNVLLCR